MTVVKRGIDISDGIAGLFKGHSLGGVERVTKANCYGGHSYSRLFC